MKRRMIERYNASERFNHWIVAIAFVLAVLSGFALFHPSLFWLSALFGSGTGARVLHPFIAVFMAVFFVWLAARFWSANHFTRDDRQWLRQIDDVVKNREDRLPPVGRYNAGQKVVFWVMLWAIALLFVSGVIIWRPYFAGYFPLGLIRAAAVLHAVSAFVALLALIVHIYSAIWVKGSIPAMTRGTVSPAWARKHHPAWERTPKS